MQLEHLTGRVRSLAFLAAFYVATALFSIVGSPLLLGPRRYAMMGLRVHARFCLWLMRVIVGTTYEVRGRQFIPDGAALVAAKHQSAWDTFALIPLMRDPAMIMKAELGYIPFYGWFSRKFEHILVARERGPAALRKLIVDAKARAADGRQIVIFPEGTRQQVHAPPAYKPGVVALYEGIGLSCVPVALNSGLFWPRLGTNLRAGTVVVEFLEPLPPGLDRRAFRAELEAKIEAATARLVAEANGDTLSEQK
jgi:1-acyl-sn-glycerol-3-phosphate acyltransferase